MIPQYNTLKFVDIWDSYDKFYNDFITSPFKDALKAENLEKLFYLLYARYGNNPIANYDIQQFKMKVYGIIFEYGSNWQRKLEIQKTLRELSEEDIVLQSKNITNHAFNPSSDPGTGFNEELRYIDNQQASTQKKGKVESYVLLWGLLTEDITEAFIEKFKVCFKLFVAPEHPALYWEEC